MIKTVDLTKKYGDLYAINSIDLELDRGDLFGFIGPNGAGKTTTIKILVGLAKPTSGPALIDGVDCFKQSKKIKRLVGYMPDTFGSYDNMRVREYLDFFARAYGLRGNERIQALRYAMGFTRLESLACKATKALSKGMKQRLCLARSLVHSP